MYLIFSLSITHRVKVTQSSQRYTRAREKMRVTINDNNKISQAKQDAIKPTLIANGLPTDVVEKHAAN